MFYYVMSPRDLTGAWDGFKHIPFCGGVGAFMLVEYERSPVGPYHEVLFIPGLFRFGWRFGLVISKIYVSSRESVMGGQDNWGIPKDHAEFAISQHGNRESWVITKGRQPIITAELEHGQTSFPVSTGILPLSLRQEWQGLHYRTKMKGQGRARSATLVNLESELPEVQQLWGRRYLGMYVDPFFLMFPKAKVSNARTLS